MFAISPVPSIGPLLAAVASAIKTISNVSDLTVNLKKSGYKNNNTTQMEYNVLLEQSKI